MPDDTRHVNHAKHNNTFLNSFYKNHEFNDWSITVSFYIVVHIIEAIIFKAKKILFNGKTITLEHSEQLSRYAMQQNISYHEARYLIVIENYPAIAGHYKILYTESRTARYRNYCYDDRQVDLLIDTCLKIIIKWYNDNHSKAIGISI
jgi:hypothetical protein